MSGNLDSIIPPHPGVYLSEEAMPASKLSVSEAARRMGVSRQSLHAVMAGSAALTTDMAVRLSKLLGGGSEVWVAMQTAHDLALSEQRLADTVIKPAFA